MLLIRCHCPLVHPTCAAQANPYTHLHTHNNTCLDILTDAALQVLELKVSMSCGGCAGAVKRIIGKLNGAKMATEPNIETQQVLVETSLSGDAVMSALKPWATGQFCPSVCFRSAVLRLSSRLPRRSSGCDPDPLPARRCAASGKSVEFIGEYK